MVAKGKKIVCFEDLKNLPWKGYKVAVMFLVPMHDWYCSMKLKRSMRRVCEMWLI